PGVAANSSRKGKRVFELVEDDWRQIEFIAQSYRPVIDANFAAIDRIFREQSTGDGRYRAFRDIFARKDITEPLPSGLTMSSLQAALPLTAVAYDGIGYDGSDPLIQDGFAYPSHMLIVYGLQHAGVVTTLGIAFRADPAGTSETADACATLIAGQHLFLIDWCRLALLDSVSALQSYFDH